MPVLSSSELAGGGPAIYPFAPMTGSEKSGDPHRSQRLKAALRENLKRRKAQAKVRARAQAAGESWDKSSPPAVGEEGG